MKLTIEKYDPSGNATAIVTTPVEARFHALLAQKIMARKELGIEQVGYAQAPQRPGSLGRLAMMGGEFCGNGSRCFAYHLAMEHIDQEVRQWVPMECSGMEGVMEVLVEKRGEHAFVTAPMPVPIGLRPFYIKGVSLPLTKVVFDGITHVVVCREASEDLAHRIQQALYREEPGLPAMGVLFYGERAQRLTPAVYVDQVGSFIWEGSCGSGSIAVAAVLAAERGATIEGLTLYQPGGELVVGAEWSQGSVKSATLSGPVKKCFVEEIELEE